MVFQTRLICCVKKSSFGSKEALFGVQRSLVCNLNKPSFFGVLDDTENQWVTIGGRASPLDNTNQTIHNSQFIISTDAINLQHYLRIITL